MGKYDNFNKNKMIDRALTKEEGFNEKLELISTNEIFPNPHQPRKIFGEEEIKELASSIAKVGLLQPIVVKKEKKNYSLIMGERRLRAVKLLRHNNIKAIVIEQNNFDNVVTALAENTHRQNLKSIEEALALKNIIEIKQCTLKDLAKIVSRSYDHIVSLLSITKLPLEIQGALLEKDIKISIQTLQALSRIKEEGKAISLFNEIINNKLNKRESLELIKSQTEENNSTDSIANNQTNTKALKINKKREDKEEKVDGNKDFIGNYYIEKYGDKKSIIIKFDSKNKEIQEKIISLLREQNFIFCH